MREKLCQCASCGEETPFCGETYTYCGACLSAREDAPIVKEYIGGCLGSLPNRRGRPEYTLSSLGFSLRTWWMGHEVYTREADGTPMGNIAILLSDGGIVIVNGKAEFEALIEDDSFSNSPTLTTLPARIASQ